MGGMVWRFAVQGLEIIKKRSLESAGEVFKFGPVLTDLLDNLVVHVGDVHDVMNGVSLELQKTTDQVPKDEGAPIADVGEIVHGGAAAVHANFLTCRIQRHEFLHRA